MPKTKEILRVFTALILCATVLWFRPIAFLPPVEAGQGESFQQVDGGLLLKLGNYAVKTPGPDKGWVYDTFNFIAGMQHVVSSSELSSNIIFFYMPAYDERGETASRDRDSMAKSALNVRLSFLSNKELFRNLEHSEIKKEIIEGKEFYTWKLRYQIDEQIVRSLTHLFIPQDAAGLYILNADVWSASLDEEGRVFAVLLECAKSLHPVGEK